MLGLLVYIYQLFKLLVTSSKFPTFLLILFIIVELFVTFDAFAISPPFARQEIIDPPNDWEIIKTYPNYTFIEDMKGGRHLVQLAKHESQCLPNSNNYRPPDIQAITYSSDGKKLRATMWLSYPLFDFPDNATGYLSPPFEDVPWYKVRYAVALGIHSVYDTEGTDYSVRYVWDASNKNWTRELQEQSPTALISTLNETYQNTFYPNEKPYINIALDLNNVTSPNSYDLLFYSVDMFVRNGFLCRMVDITSRVYVPPPEFTIKISPSSMTLRPSDQKSAELQIKSNSDVKTQVYLSSNQDDGNVTLNFVPNRTSLSSHGLASSELIINASDNAKPRPYTLPISVNISVPTEAKPRRSVTTGEIVLNPVSANISERSNFTATVLPSLTWIEKVEEILKTVRPFGELWQIFAAIGGASITAVFYFKKVRGSKNESRWNREIDF